MTTRRAVLALAAVAAAPLVAPIGFNARRERDSARDFSRDGCRTDADVRYRRDMLRNIGDGLARGSVLPRERTWKA